MTENREKFVRLANKRVNSAIKTIRLIGNLSNKSNYSYSTEDVEKIFRALQEELRSAKSKFGDERGRDRGAFTLEP